MRDIRMDLIKKEFADLESREVSFKHFIPTTRFLDWLFARYTVVEYSVHYYDSEPEVPAEWHRDGEEWNDPEFRKIWKDLVQEYEPQRMKFCNWVDPFGKGIWDWSQERTDRGARELFEELIEDIEDKDDRFYVGFGAKGEAYVYFYGRDVVEYDVWFVLARLPEIIR